MSNQETENTDAHLSVVVHPVAYIMGASAGLMDRIRRDTGNWGEGDENICMTDEQAREIPELAAVLETVDAAGCDVVVSV